MNTHAEFVWLRHPEAATYVEELLDQFADALPPVRTFTADLLARTGSRLVDWLDHLVVSDGELPRGQLADLGFEPEEVPGGKSVAAVFRY